LDVGLGEDGFDDLAHLAVVARCCTLLLHQDQKGQSRYPDWPLPCVEMRGF
jgi:hypothetical protein